MTGLVITRQHAEKIVELLGHGLVHGIGEPIPGKMCVEAMVCYALGLPHGDDPGCVSIPLRRLKIKLNDSRWSSDQARAKGLRRLAIAQLGSKGVLDDKLFMQRVAEMTIRKSVPTCLRLAAKRNPKFAAELENAALRCEQEGTREAARDAESVARKAAAADAAYAAYAAYAAAYAADAYAAAYAADAYAADAYAAAAAAADDDDDDDDDDDARDTSLAQYCEWIVEILIDLQAPGCEFLDLVPLEA